MIYHTPLGRIFRADYLQSTGGIHPTKVTVLRKVLTRYCHRRLASLRVLELPCRRESGCRNSSEGVCYIITRVIGKWSTLFFVACCAKSVRMGLTRPGFCTSSRLFATPRGIDSVSTSVGCCTSIDSDIQLLINKKTHRNRIRYRHWIHPSFRSVSA